MEWFFLVLATLTILGLLVMAMERFVSLHRQFGQFMPEDNCTDSSSQEVAELVAAKIQQYKLQSDVLFDEFGDFQNGSDHDESCKSCDYWTCTNDFIFAVALVVNLCKLHEQ